MVCKKPSLETCISLEYSEMHGERMFGPANGGLCWQIRVTVRKIGEGHRFICIPRWLLGKNESILRTTLLSVY